MKGSFNSEAAAIQKTTSAVELLLPSRWGFDQNKLFAALLFGCQGGSCIEAPRSKEGEGEKWVLLILVHGRVFPFRDYFCR